MEYLNQGMYDVAEAARLVGVSPGRVATWTTGTKRRDALLTPSLRPLFTFHDLISLRVVAQLVHCGVGLTDIASGLNTLRRAWSTPAPLAHRRAVDCLGTIGSSLLGKLDGPSDDWTDVSKGGQGVFQEVILPDLRGVEYGNDDLAEIWRPASHVWLNPRVQAGASCIDQTRIPTALICDLLNRGEAAADVASAYDLDVADVMAAREFERHLLAA